MGRVDGSGRALLLPLTTAVFVACSLAPAPPTTSGGTESGERSAAAATPTPPIGGTLRVGLPGLGEDGEPETGALDRLYLDPAHKFGLDELHRCCLLRTPLSYNGRTTADGGVILRPDLAEALPEVSPDGLTWTFRIREGMRYAPPYDDTVITARDIVRGIERSIPVRGLEVAVPREGANFFASVSGIDAYMDGSASAIAGLEAPDARTLVVRLREPNADIATAMSLAYAAPVPEGAAETHDDDYGDFLVASGPYMYEGATDLEKGGRGPRLSADHGPHSAVLVRNPSWDRATDALRGAWVDRIEVSRSLSLEDDRARLERGDIDVPGYAIERDELDRLDAETRSRTAFATFPLLMYVPLNLALPPLDDIDVRRAINLAIDRAAVVEATPGRIGTTLRVAHHAIPDSLQNNLLLDYDPFPTADDGGDLAAAREAMARSRYDDDGDGLCDAPACEGVPLAIWPGDEDAAAIVSENLSAIGITLEPRSDDAFPYDVRARNGLFVIAGWIADTPALGGFISPFFRAPIADDEGVTSTSATLIGASPGDLADWGYEPTEVPSVDAKVDECLALTGSQRFICAAELDQLVMERAVAMVPIALPEVGFLYGERVVTYSIDQSVVAPALDQIAIAP